MITPYLPTLNLSVDNALSLQQIIHQLITEINNIIEYINNTDDKTDAKIKTALSDYDTMLQEQLESLEDRLQSEITKAKDIGRNYTNLKVEEIYNEIDKVVNQLDAQIVDVDEKAAAYYDILDSEIEILRNEIANIRRVNTMAVSPLDGMSKPISDVVYDLNQHSLLCSSYNIQQMLEYAYADSEIENKVKGTWKPLITNIETFMKQQPTFIESTTVASNTIATFQLGSGTIYSLITSSKAFIRNCRKTVESVSTGERTLTEIADCFDDITDWDNSIYASHYISFNPIAYLNVTFFKDENVRESRLMKARDMGLLNDDYTIKESGVYPL